MTVLTPQHIGIDWPVPTYYAINSPEYIDLEASVFLHFYNGSAVDDIITVIATNQVLGVYNCFVTTCEAGGELILGPFDLAIFGPTVELIHSTTAGVTMAALLPSDVYCRGVRINTDLVKLVNFYNVTLNSKMIDVTPLCAEYQSQRPTSRWATFSAGGFFDYYNDVTGQKLIMDNAVNGAPLTWQSLSQNFSAASSSHITADINVTDFTIHTTPYGVIEFNFTADSTGEVVYG